jgi:hypothetical protein
MHIRSMAAAALTLLVGACAQVGSVLSGGDAQSAREFLPDGGPPVVNGFYEVTQDMCSANPCVGLLAMQPVALRDRPHPDAAIVATTTEREWVDWIGEVYRKRPVRGVVREAMDLNIIQRVIRFQAGDIVYVIDEREDGSDAPEIAIWFRGDTIYQFISEYEGIDQLSVDWDSRSDAQIAADAAAGGGWWVEVRRENGQRGFAARYDFDCGWGGKDHSGYCDRDSPPPPPRDCPAHDISWECVELRNQAAPSSASYPTPRPFRDCADCPSMVWIPGQSFAAGQYEVTFAEWDACVADGGCTGSTPNDQGWGRGNRPVMGVRWADAQAYVQWLSRHTGQRYRLLTTDEWTAAAFPGGRRQNYSWGNEEPVCTLGARNGAAYNACLPQRTMPVGSFQPNAFGLYDTIGNVGEWLQDPYAPGDARYAIIGSSWASGLDALGGRGGGQIYDLGPDTGFRVARER